LSEVPSPGAVSRTRTSSSTALTVNPGCLPFRGGTYARYDRNVSSARNPGGPEPRIAVRLRDRNAALLEDRLHWDRRVHPACPQGSDVARRRRARACQFRVGLHARQLRVQPAALCAWRRTDSAPRNTRPRGNRDTCPSPPELCRQQVVCRESRSTSASFGALPFTRWGGLAHWNDDKSHMRRSAPRTSSSRPRRA